MGLILHDSDDKETRKQIIKDFKKNMTIDLLIVFNMLLTGFDAPRLKRLYFGRKLKDHNLLQALTRVNRPYKDNRYGYVIDFLDIFIGQHHWPAFNIADSAICIGVTVFIVHNLLFDREADEQA